jgi:Domain of unknown function (DUF3520)
MNSTDHPDMTAYALGELNTEQAEAFAQWSSAQSEVQSDMEQTMALAAHLRATAVLPEYRLHPRQREAALGGPQRVLRQFSKPPARYGAQAWTQVAGTVGRWAAAAAVVSCAYIIGGMRAGSPQVVARPSVTPVPVAPMAQPVFVAAPAVAVVPNVQQRPVSVPAVPVVAVAEVAKPVMKLAAMAPSLVPVVVAASPRDVAQHRVATAALVSTSRASQTQFVLRPAATRPVLGGGAAVAAAPVKSPAVAGADPVDGRRPELLIHSWKADVTSSPWNPGRRLLRLALQIPGEQEAARGAGETYPLTVSFDPNQVRAFRQVAQRLVPASSADGPAFQIVWYEFQPNGQLIDPMRDGASRTIAAATLSKARFTTATTAPFDDSRLQIVDRGYSWERADDNFLYEAAVTGFGLLLQGEKDIGELNHATVLDLVSRSLAADSSGERGRFAKVVKDAQRAAGL